MLIYVAGSIRPKNGQTLEGNLKQAKDIALELWKGGYAVICPHANTFLDESVYIDEKECDGIGWIDGDLEMIGRCDAVVVCPDYEESKGTLREIEYAEDRAIPIYYWPDFPKITATELLRPRQCESFMSTIMNMYRVHLRKNADYSPANIIGTGEIGVVVRLWDKIARLLNLTGFRIEIKSSAFEKPLVPQNESIDDAYMDTAVYAIIAQLVRKGVWGK